MGRSFTVVPLFVPRLVFFPIDELTVAETTAEFHDTDIAGIQRAIKAATHNHRPLQPG